MKLKISLILPTYNEKDNIVPLVKSLIQIIGHNNYEILIVDDNSPDKTAQIVRIRFKNNPRIKIFVRKKDKGLAVSIKSGLDRASGNLLLVMDTDFNHDPNEIPLMIKKIKNYDLIVGSRYTSGGGMENRLRYYFSYIYNRLVQFLLGLKTRDNLSGFFLIKKESLDKLKLSDIFKGYGDYFLRFLSSCQKQRFKIAEIPIFYKNRTAGRSKSKFLKMLTDYTKTVIELKYRN